jgi:hypothetical protein
MRMYEQNMQESQDSVKRPNLKTIWIEGEEVYPKSTGNIFKQVKG